MVAEQSCVKRLWTIVPELYQDGYGGTIGAIGTIFTAGWQCVASCELQDRVLGVCGWYNDYGGLDGGHACARETLYLRWRRSIVEGLELRHVVFLSSSLAGTTCIDGKGTNQCRRHAERTSHLGRAGVEQTAVLHAQSEYERRSAEETAERA